MLAREFLSSGQTKVLLLSATPYKPYATLEEIAQDEGAEHYGEFMQVMDFLFHRPKQREQFHTVWQQYSHALCEVSGEKLTVLMARKAEAERRRAPWPRMMICSGPSEVATRTRWCLPIS